MRSGVCVQAAFRGLRLLCAGPLELPGEDAR